MQVEAFVSSGGGGKVVGLGLTSACLSRRSNGKLMEWVAGWLIHTINHLCPVRFTRNPKCSSRVKCVHRIRGAGLSRDTEVPSGDLAHPHWGSLHILKPILWSWSNLDSSLGTKLESTLVADVLGPTSSRKDEQSEMRTLASSNPLSGTGGSRRLEGGWVADVVTRHKGYGCEIERRLGMIISVTNTCGQKDKESLPARSRCGQEIQLWWRKQETRKRSPLTQPPFCCCCCCYVRYLF